MFPAAYLRARKLTEARSGSMLLGRVLGAIQAILLVKLLCVAGLLLGLCETGGTTRLSAERVAEMEEAKLPRWLADRLPANAEGRQSVENTGLYPLVEAGRASADPLHHWAGRAADRILRVMPVLRNDQGALRVLLAAGLALLVVVAYCGFWRRQLAASAAGAAASSLRHQIHRQVYRLGQAALPGEGTGPAVDLFTREVNLVRDGLMAEVDHAWRAPVLVFSLLATGLLLSWPVTIFLVALAGLAILAARPMARGIRRQADAAARDAAVRLCLLQEDLEMLRTVRVYGMEEVDRGRFDEHLRQFQADDARFLREEARLAPALWFVDGVAATLALGLLAFLVLTGRLSPTGAVVLAAVAVALARPIRDWLALREALRVAGRSADAIFRYLERKPELQQAVGAQFLAPLKQSINLENVSLEAPGGRTLLSGVSVEIPAKSRTALLSLDESSKHAIACLIPRLIDPKLGKVRMDGQDLRDVTLESIRAQVALVLQADLIFNDTVFANIGLGDPSYGLPKIIEAAKVAHAHHLIQDLPHGYDTPIGSLGHYLGSDAQYRIALARAFLHDPSIVVIEEPTAPMDEDTKHLIDDTIDRIAAGRTVIFLPHRLSTIRKCDRVIVLHNGRIESAGTPREVHAASKLYRHIQYVEFNQFATGEIEAGQMGG
jgi:ATP-binding cassette, subfamily B, bacterial